MVQRVILGGIGVLMLTTMYLFQRYNFAGLLEVELHPHAVFAVNKTIRLIINDAACCLIILAIFRQSRYLRLSLYVFLFELLILLPAYLSLKLALEGDSEISSPLFSQFHRLIVNPMLMIVLMIGFFFQRFREQRVI